MESSDIKIFSGLSNVPLAEKIVKRLVLPLGSVEFKRFSDGEIWVKYGENIKVRMSILSNLLILPQIIFWNYL